MVKEFILKKTAKATANANNLIQCPYGLNTDIYYDFSLLDTIQFDYDYEKEMLEQDIMKYHSCAWYTQPLPTLIMWNNFTTYHGQVQVNVDRVFKANGKRMMVIVEVCKLKITRDTRPNIYEQYYTTEREYTADSGYRQRAMDLEVSA